MCQAAEGKGPDAASSDEDKEPGWSQGGPYYTGGTLYEDHSEGNHPTFDESGTLGGQ